MDSVELMENINIAEACRACFETCKHYKFLFDEAESIENRTLGDVFYDVVKIEMSPNSETAPTRICLACSYDLVNAYNFIQKSKKNNERLIQLSKHPNINKSDCLTEFEVDIPHDQNISDTFQIKIEKETVHEYNYSMLLEHNNSSINSFGSDGSDCEPLANKQVKIPKLQCPYCYRIFKKQHLHESHMRTHTEGDVKKNEESEDGNKLECYECDFNCHSDLEMEKHQKSEHTSRMDSKSFYGCDKHVNPRPGYGFRSDLSSDSDDEYDFPRRSSVAIHDRESDFSDDETNLPKTSKVTSTSIKPAKIDWMDFPQFNSKEECDNWIVQYGILTKQTFKRARTTTITDKYKDKFPNHDLYYRQITFVCDHVNLDQWKKKKTGGIPQCPGQIYVSHTKDKTKLEVKSIKPCEHKLLQPLVKTATKPKCPKRKPEKLRQQEIEN